MSRQNNNLLPLILRTPRFFRGEILKIRESKALKPTLKMMPMRIAILLGTAEFIVIKADDTVAEKIAEQWGLAVKTVVNRQYQIEYVTDNGMTVVVKPFNP